MRRHFEDEKELLALVKSAIGHAKAGNVAALERLVEALDGPRVQRHAVAASVVDLGNADDTTLDQLECILERIAPGPLPDA